MCQYLIFFSKKSKIGRCVNFDEFDVIPYTAYGLYSKIIRGLVSIDFLNALYSITVFRFLTVHIFNQLS